MRTGDDVDRILAEKEEIVPSSAFTTAVMEAVRREAATPPPIPFPWKRALPGLAAAALALVLAVVEASALPSRGAIPSAPFVRWLTVLAPLAQTAAAAGGRWIVLALLLTVASVRLSMRLTRAAS